MPSSTKQTSAQDFVPIADIRDGVVILKDGQMCSVLLASSINFALKSTDEQTAILAQFQAFLNTLDFSIQMHVESRRLDIRPYLEMLATRESTQYNDLMRTQLREYMEFIRSFTEEVDIMAKRFFLVIPYSPTTTNVRSNITSFLGRRSTAPFDANRFREHQTQLEQRVDVVTQGLARIGVKTLPLGTDELTELYYHIFNPGEQSAAPRPTNAI
ncbi:hypothetical protein GW943_02820 [Candidatus Parcubacteria bacterium]|uniref:TraC-like domain-containing protein n=1 Tax=Candidatus Kaiserbacteria bacterium CG10_big_fil_rev_8_21_14_0_10_47_16 TaxID=1974608 RepID=A0A2H0UDX6_9BACT|nr:hypothetical protein [Candidatus Parcubacteria bacterium]PIR84609.1 MAG: hypothetical protein COU16_03485 [Candidatus Kaiserbacteria bacterium CG10_big_fil_rev_8_21_14_0_10_47_16]